MNARPRPQPGGLALFQPGLALSGGALTLCGALLAGGSFRDWGLYPAVIGSVLLFAAGSAFTHFFETARPEPRDPREPLQTSEETGTAWRFGWLALIPGAALPALGGRYAALISVGIALLLVLYASQFRTVWGPGFFTFGAARALALLLGQAVVPMALERFWNVSLPILVYAVGWEVLRCSRQPGAPRSTALVALAHLTFGVSLALYQGAWTTFHWPEALPLLVVLFLVSFPRFVGAVMLVGLAPAQLAIQYGLLGELLLGAVVVAGYNSLLPALAVCAVGLVLFQTLERWPVPLVTQPR